VNAVAPGGPSYRIARRLFLRLIGVVYVIAFASLALQVTGLVGRRGILPAGAFLEWAHGTYGRAAYQLLPTVFWLGAGDTALRLAAWGGAVLGALVVLGAAPRLVLALLWLLYLSLSVVGQEFLSFQWDALLLEAGLLACLWAPPGWLPRRAATQPAPSEAVRWALVFLVFKLMFLSGATKLLSGDPTWRNLTALDYHFWTQPLPTWTAWHAAHLPSAAHRLLTVGNFVIELGAPWLLLVPARWRALRVLGCLALAALQVGIGATGNYGFFNLLSIVLLVPTLDDAVWRRLAPRWLGSRAAQSVPPEEAAAGAPGDAAARAAHPVLAAGAGIILFLSVLSFWRELALTAASGTGARWFPAAAEELLGLAAPFRSVNGYGLFRVMTTERPELVIEGSDDGRTWREYVFRWKPGPVGRRPGFVEPHMPRLDWQMWFAALDPVGNYGWLESFLARLRDGSPDVTALVGPQSFAGPPKQLRVVQYSYRFTSAEERRRTGAWWVRERAAETPVGTDMR
jgi:hypothetical protein